LPYLEADLKRRFVAAKDTLYFITNGTKHVASLEPEMDEYDEYDQYDEYRAFSGNMISSRTTTSFRWVDLFLKKAFTIC